MGVKAKKNFFDASDFDYVDGALDLVAESFRRVVKFDALEGKETFLARVLSPPIPLSTREAQMEKYFSGLKSNAAGTIFFGDIEKFKFRIRIVDDLTPHVFWPEPCDPRFLTDEDAKKEALDWIANHTEAVCIGAENKPTPGDYIRVLLKNNIYTVSPEVALQVEYVQDLTPKESKRIEQDRNKECPTPLANTFAAEQTKAPTVASATSERGVSYTAHFEDDAPELLFPVDSSSAKFGSKFGMRWHPIHKKHKFHYGQDIKTAPRGTPVIAAADGVIERVVSGLGEGGSGYGNLVTIKHTVNGKTYYTKYAHLLQDNYSKGGTTIPKGVVVSKGQSVKKGDLIGYVGNTGGSRGPHLHFELQNASKKHLNPVFHMEGKHAESRAQQLNEQATGGIAATKSEPELPQETEKTVSQIETGVASRITPTSGGSTSSSGASSSTSTAEPARPRIRPRGTSTSAY